MSTPTIWPRGKYNGQRIVGIEVKVRIDVTHWAIWFHLRSCSSGFGIGPLIVHYGFNYE